MIFVVVNVVLVVEKSLWFHEIDERYRFIVQPVRGRPIENWIECPNMQYKDEETKFEKSLLKSYCLLGLARPGYLYLNFEWTDTGEF